MGSGRANRGRVRALYGAGELSALNAIAGAYAEYVPVVLISSAPNVCGPSSPSRCRRRS